MQLNFGKITYLNLTMPYSQTPHTLLMIQPAAFSYNNQTAGSNFFQNSARDWEDVHEKAVNEFDKVVNQLSEQGINVLVIQDTKDPIKPDAIFPNNWISTHADGLIIIYPLFAFNRRAERRMDLISRLKEQFTVKDVWDISENENNGRFLEGTGSIVFDHAHKTAYACRSVRTNENLLNLVCERLRYKAILFGAVDEQNNPVYHTNILMWIGEQVAVVCLDAIKKEEDQEQILGALAATNRKVIAVSYQQMNAFAGNMFEVKNTKGDNFVLLSQTAFESLLPGQLNEITRYAEPLVVSIETIQKYGGGGVRCMVTGIYLEKKSLQTDLNSL
jgi:hypothetical protein